MKKRRYLIETIEEIKTDNEDETKEKETLEKSVNIRFANYSAMIRS
jgi:hypothetical protein